MVIRRVKKRSGELVAFDSEKIRAAVGKAMKAVDEYDEKACDILGDEVVVALNLKEDKFALGIPGIEDIQDVVIEVLARNSFDRTAKAYMLYRKSRKQAREFRKFFGVRDDLKFDVNAIRVLKERYLLKDKEGRTIETPTEMFRRVAGAVAGAEKEHRKEWEELFFEMMKKLEFLPNSPTLMNAGTSLGQLSACYVLPVEDDLGEIFDTLKKMSMIQQSGAGTGFSFSKLRPRGDIVGSTKGIASGPVSFMKIYDKTTDVIKQGGKRRGANMGILNASHPDIIEFINAKAGEKELSNFNISVAIDDKFMDAVEKNKDYSLTSPHSGKEAGRIKARKVFEIICKNAWKTGDPGLIFIDEINRKNQVAGIGKIEATNPCSEVPLLPYESCNLGSINLTKVVKNEKIDWEKLRLLVRYGIRFLDDVIDVNKYPFSELDMMARANRRVGLGVMGFADMLILLEIPYNSNRAIEISGEIMKFIEKEAHLASEEIAMEKGNFPNFGKSIWKGRKKWMRNCACTAIAPTGTISIIAGCSSGIEPIFALAFMREILEGKDLLETNKIFEQVLLTKGLYSPEILKKAAILGNLSSVILPFRIKNLFKTALEIPLEQHIMIQGAFQKYTDNAVSKTINLPKNASWLDVEKAYKLAYRHGCKGITIYRYGSKENQVLYFGKGKKASRAMGEYSGGECMGKSCML